MANPLQPPFEQISRGALAVITTNRVFREWGKIFDVDNTLATAMIDRLRRYGEAIVIDGKSYRTGEGGEQ